MRRVRSRARGVWLISCESPSSSFSSLIRIPLPLDSSICLETDNEGRRHDNPRRKTHPPRQLNHHWARHPLTPSLNPDRTCTNTLGSSLILDADLKPALNSESGTGIGGLAGAALHPLALGNVATFRRLLDQQSETRDILVIGVGGVEDKGGVERMRSVGAGAVGCASALGRFGVGVFSKMTS
jgi:hypothetical protein